MKEVKKDADRPPRSVESALADGWTIKIESGRQVVLVKDGKSVTLYRPKIAQRTLATSDKPEHVINAVLARRIADLRRSGKKWLPEAGPAPRVYLGDPWSYDEVPLKPEPKAEVYRFRHCETGALLEIEYVRSQEILRVQSANAHGAKIIRLIAPKRDRLDGATVELVLGIPGDPFLSFRLDPLPMKARLGILVAVQGGDVTIELLSD